MLHRPEWRTSTGASSRSEAVSKHSPPSKFALHFWVFGHYKRVHFHTLNAKWETFLCSFLKTVDKTKMWQLRYEKQHEEEDDYTCDTERSHL